MTIMTTTFIPCGAKLPFIAMIAGAIFGGASWVAPSAYFLGIAAIICSGIILKKTKMFCRRSCSVRYGAAGLPSGRPSATYSAACGSAAGPSSRRPAPSSCCPPSLSGSPPTSAVVDGAFQMLAEDRDRLQHPCHHRQRDLLGSLLRWAGATGRPLWLPSPVLSQRRTLSVRLVSCMAAATARVYSNMAATLHGSHRLCLPGIQPSVRTLLRGNGCNQA